MQLTYRGVHYEYTSHTAEAHREANVFRAIRPTFNLHYRGSVYTVDPNAEPSVPVMHSPAQLLYRGAAYALNGGAEPVAVTSNASNAVSNPSFNRKHSATAFSTVHRDNLHTNLQRRLQIARERGDQNLISLLERELQQIA